MVTAFGTAPTSSQINDLRQPIIENLTLQAVETVSLDSQNFFREERIQQGDTVASLLTRLGIEEPEILNRLKIIPNAQPLFRQMSPGKHVVAQINEQGELQSLQFPLNGNKDQVLMITREQNGSFRAQEQPLLLETRIVTKSAEIEHSLFGAADAAGIPDAIATQLADIFGGDIDFYRDIRKGDRFTVVYEVITYLGRAIRTGRILAAEFENDGHRFDAIWFSGKHESGGYYTADGKNIRKAFLRSPLEFSRITSGFTNSRYHPVLKEWRAHRGVDYGAPSGTRVRATGDGVVEFIGRQGGYGNLIVLRHQGNYSTYYGHLSGFASGLHKGSRVSQADLIGYVGATGLATGPHLHYEFRIRDIQQNPLALALPSAPPLDRSQFSEFQGHAQQMLGKMSMYDRSPIALLD